MMTSDKPILVIEGNVCKETNAWPINLFALDYIVISDVDKMSLRLKILSLEKTKCTIYSVHGRYGELEFELTKRSHCFIKTMNVYSNDTVFAMKCQKPVRAALYVDSYRNTYALTLVPNHLWGSVYAFARPINNDRLPYYLHIIIGEAHRDGLTLNDSPFKNQSWKSIRMPEGHFPYVYLQKRLDNTLEYVYLKALDPRVTFMVYATGRDYDDGLGTSLGGVFVFPDKPDTFQCQEQLQTMTAGDDIDNDCDGLFDEELLDGKDDDGDDRIDEDLVRMRVNGGWGSWTPVYCNATCTKPGMRIRRRQCNNPLPINNGAVCAGGFVRTLNKCTSDNFTCPEVCPMGTFTPTCQAPCSENCSNAGCQKVSGVCYSCPCGFTGRFCTHSGYKQVLPTIVSHLNKSEVVTTSTTEATTTEATKHTSSSYFILVWAFSGFLILFIIGAEIKRRTKSTKEEINDDSSYSTLQDNAELTEPNSPQ